MTKQQSNNHTGSRKQALPHFLTRRLSEGGFILVATFALFVLLSLSTYDLSDPNWSQVSKSNTEISNAGGQVGAYIADALYLVFGYFSFCIPLVFAYIAWIVLKDYRAFHTINRPAMLLRSSGFIFMMLGGGLLQV
ncbi:DNA translocase FtsK 4TM domain-containing protein [Legionella clemsonensis]|uniref:DNA translocase FtsK n=1 Tax=Legionella clemsonensis TaxID=1867846 RepID=A0A222P0P5_9GAMM|nr:DNA translocase FtsK 4TM domain-containing protein [Legionella clemsonensis]ASQ45402.1 DNA translocase FtsK [Legionella clemsonensis]